MQTTWNLSCNKTKPLTFLILFLLLTVTPVNAITGSKWLEWCEDGHADTNGLCLGYIYGAVDYQWWIQSLKLAEMKLCIPPRVTRGQLMEITKKYLKEHPDKWHIEMSSLFFLAIKETFPCKEN